jgi:hypothetical protein
MNQFNHIKSNLLAFGLPITSVNEIPYGHQIRIECGAIINVFDKGTVLVQGKLHPFRKTENLTLLKRALPPETKWPATMVENSVTKALILSIDGYYVERQMIGLK